MLIRTYIAELRLGSSSVLLQVRNSSQLSKPLGTTVFLLSPEKAIKIRGREGGRERLAKHSHIEKVSAGTF